MVKRTLEHLADLAHGLRGSSQRPVWGTLNGARSSPSCGTPCHARVRACGGLLLGLWSILAFAVQIDVSVDPNPPPAGESFRLAFVVKGELDGEPDFSPLEKKFEVLGRNRQTALAWVNGKHTRTSTWVVEVLPKNAGPLEVPAIAFGDTRSAPLVIQTAAGGPAAPTEDGLFLEVDAVPRDPYVQQQVTYTIRLWRRYELSNASLSEPHLNGDAIVRPLGEDRQYEAERGGKRYEIIERRFALFPQASGTSTIAPVTVTAQVLERVTSLFEMFGRSVKTRRISSAEVTLNVRPIPTEYPANAAWLPARKVRVNELWEPPELRVKAGDPLTRTVSLWVSGLTSGQLPEILPATVSGLKVYPDQPQLKEDKQDGLITAVRQEKVALIPTVGGEFALPALAIPWWNTETDALEFARAPAQRLIAVADPMAAMQTAVPTAAPLAPTTPAVAPTPIPLSPAGPPDWRAWQGWFAVALGALLGWPASLLWVLRRRPRQASSSTAKDRRVYEPPLLRTAREAVLKSAWAHAPATTRSNLLAWAQAQWPGVAPVTLGGLAAKVTPALAAAIHALDFALYGRATPPWQGDTLATAFAAYAKTVVARAPPPPPLPKIFKLAS